MTVNNTEAEFQRTPTSSGFKAAELSGFVKHINHQLERDSDLRDRLPVTTASFFGACQDGLLLCKLINSFVPNTIDESKMNRQIRDEKKRLFQSVENQNLCLAAASKLGCNVVNIGPMDLENLILGLIWQIVKQGSLSQVSLASHPELTQIGDDDLANLPPEQLLYRWMNFNIRNKNLGEMRNLSTDICDSTKYVHLMHKLNPAACPLDILNEPDLLVRAQKMLKCAEDMGCYLILTPEDVVSGNERLNLVFLSQLFQKQNGLIPLADEIEQRERENSSLKDQLKTRNEVEQNLSKRIDELSKKLTIVTGENMTLKKEKAELLHKLQLLQDIVDSKSQQSDLQLQILTEKFNMVSDELRKEKMTLESSEFNGQTMSMELEKMRSKQASLEYVIEHLKIERQRSDEHVARLRLLYNTYPTTEALCEAIYSHLTMSNVLINSSMTGFLTKKARFGSSWKHRFHVLRDNFLFYFKNDKDKNEVASGVVRVDDATLKMVENTQYPDLKQPYILCLEITSAPKPLSFFLAGDKAVLDEWNDAIKLASAWWTRKSSVEKLKSTNVRRSFNSVSSN